MSVSFISNNNAPKTKLLVFGNSITLHSEAPDIGWNGCWGMAASKPENDFVHRLISMLEPSLGPVSCCIAQGAEWERHYHDPGTLEEMYGEARDFNADIVVIRIGENIPDDDMKEYPLEPYFEKMIDFLSPNKEALIVVTDMFWRNAGKNIAAYEAASNKKARFVSLSDLGDKDENMAVGLFEHSGVAHHPGDLGMLRIAERICQSIK